MVTRRRIMLVAPISALITPFACLAQQQPVRRPRIGILGSAPGAQWTAFQQQLRKLGYEEGRNIEYVFRWSEGRNERLKAFAAELIEREASVIVTEGTLAAQIASKTTTTVPIVMAISSDPVRGGIVTSLARPGGNVTGLSSLSPKLVAKQMELMKELTPGIKRVGVLNNPHHPLAKELQQEAESVARALKLQIVLFPSRGRADYFESFSNMRKERCDSVLILPDPTFDAEQDWLADFAAKSKLPALYNKAAFAEAGGLISYGASYSEFFLRAATYVDKILKGAKPSDLPIEQATRFELHINLKTAKALGIKVPKSVLVRADKLIE